jgi:hypothetical protein
MLRKGTKFPVCFSRCRDDEESHAMEIRSATPSDFWEEYYPELSDDAKDVAEIALEQNPMCPIDGDVKRSRQIQSQIRKILKREGWSIERINGAFQELRCL